MPSPWARQGRLANPHASCLQPNVKDLLRKRLFALDEAKARWPHCDRPSAGDQHLKAKSQGGHERYAKLVVRLADPRRPRLG